MKVRIAILVLFSIQFVCAQNQSSDKSRSFEKEGWGLYFEEKFEDAKIKFIKAIELDSTNLLAKIGLFNSKGRNELDQSDLVLIDNLPEQGDYKDIVYNLMLTKEVDKELPDSIKVMRSKYDESYIKFRARLMDSDFKVYDEDENVRQTGSYKNGKPYGSWKKYGYKNRLHHSFTFPEVGDTIVIKYFKPDGDLIKEEWTTGTPFTNESKRFKEIVYWQETPGKDKSYLFVSKEGFMIYDRENPVVFDESTPDNIIQITHNPKTHDREAYIWKDGKKIPFEYCPYDGTVVSYSEDGKKKSFRWENCKKVLIED